MAGKLRKGQSRRTRRRASRRKGFAWRISPSRTKLVASAGLAVFLGCALGYGLGVLDRPAPERPVSAALEPESPGPPQRSGADAAPEHSSALPPGAGKATRPESGGDRPAARARPSEPAWIRNSVRWAEAGGKPAIAIVIDDVGLNPAQTRKIVALPAPVTMAFLTYADRLPQQTASARAAGHELLVHFPMEPLGDDADPGPNALLAELDDAEISRRLRWGLSRFEGYVGINNHMGSRFTSSVHQMDVVLRELKARGLLFLDSATSPDSVGVDLSRNLGLPHAVRDVFLDNSRNRAAIRKSLALLEKRARTDGSAIGIGHPFDETIEEVAAWMKGVRARGFSLVPLTAVVRRNTAPSRQFGARRHDPAG